MQIEKTSDIIAHFIGYFEQLLDGARGRASIAGGSVKEDLPDRIDGAPVVSLDVTSDFELKDYVPDLAYHVRNVHLARAVHSGHGAGHHGKRHRDHDDGAEGHHHRMHGPGANGGAGEQPLPLHVGPGSTISHITQVNVLADSDVLSMGPTASVLMDTRYVMARLDDYGDAARGFTPFADHHRTDSLEGLRTIADEVHAFRASTEAMAEALGLGIRLAPETPAPTGEAEPVAAGPLVLGPADLAGAMPGLQILAVGDTITGTHVNGAVSTTPPVLKDMLPDRGLAAAEAPIDYTKGPDTATTPLHPSDTLHVEAGANIAANIANVTETAVVGSVFSVMGSYHQVDVINQATAYGDMDVVLSGHGTASLIASGSSPATAAFNIASFARTSLEHGNDPDPAAPQDVTFPNVWRVSTIDGDVSFVHWIEQYNFVTDNDQLTIRNSGVETSILSGGNGAINNVSFLGLGHIYDLVIVGGNVLDMNIISQQAFLYDSDRIGAGLQDGGESLETGNNLLWNQAIIHNVGAADRFEAMPDTMNAARQAIEDRDPSMPAGLAQHPDFAGQKVLDVLYIKGNLTDVTYLKQVSVLGDADFVNKAASELLTSRPGSIATIDTGSNAVVNLAQIIDYDSFGTKTYLGGGLYSDAVLIQGGLIDRDVVTPHAAGNSLANEVIAFLHDDVPQANAASEALIQTGHDLSWHAASPADVMQNVVA